MHMFAARLPLRNLAAYSRCFLEHEAHCFFPGTGALLPQRVQTLFARLAALVRGVLFLAAVEGIGHLLSAIVRKHRLKPDSVVRMHRGICHARATLVPDIDDDCLGSRVIDPSQAVLIRC